MNWIRLTDDNLASAFGPDASYLLLHHRKQLDSLIADLLRGDQLNKRWRELYGDSAIQYVRNSHFLFDREGIIRAAGSKQHCEAYYKPGYIIVLRDNCQCENNGDYCEWCLSNLN